MWRADQIKTFFSNAYAMHMVYFRIQLAIVILHKFVASFSTVSTLSLRSESLSGIPRLSCPAYKEKSAKRFRKLVLVANESGERRLSSDI